jgi:hypothetical protein
MFATAVIIYTAATFAKAEYVTVSLRPVANDLKNWIPNMPVGMQTLGGVPFDLLPLTGNNSWSAAVSTTAGIPSTQTMVLPVNISGATAVDTLINNTCGAPGATYVSLSFVCSDGTTHTVTLKEGTDIRDWFEGLIVNKINNTTTVQVLTGTNQKVYAKTDHGRIDKQHIALPGEFANRTLAYIILTDNGITGTDDMSYCKRIGAQRSFICGVTVTTGKPEPATMNTEPDKLSLDRLSQEMTDEAISKLKGKEAKQMSDLMLKYQKDQSALAQERQNLDEEMERETLKLIVLPSGNTGEIPKADQEILKAVDAAMDNADTAQAEATKKTVLALLDKNSVWDEPTQTRQYKMFVAAPADKRQQLLVLYRKFEQQFAAQIQSEIALQEQKKKDIFAILSPDSK